MTFNGKKVYSSEEFDYRNAKVGDYVEEEIVDDLINCVPPISMSRSCSQCGEPNSMRQDPDTGKWRNTFTTFVCVDPDGHVWEYRGDCFAHETRTRGIEPQYVRMEDY